MHTISMKNLLLRKILFLLCAILMVTSSNGQKIGLVLSGGGASATAHIGVIKALEENNIPIHYITGTSMGALIGAMYAAGYSPEEMERLFTTDSFYYWATGKAEELYSYFFYKNDDDASIVTLKISPDSNFQTSLPTSLINSFPIDFALMKFLAPAIAAAGYNFDSLMIPFRCVAADIVAKKPIIFRKGYLPTAVRASMTYPFYLRPLKVNDMLLYDGGIYNNFPADVMYKDFLPDFIIGSNVSYNFPDPDEDNIVSQIRSMLVSKTDYSIQCQMGYIIEPNTDPYGTFDFDKIPELIQRGYQAAIQSIDSLKRCLYMEDLVFDTPQKRAAFRKKIPALEFYKIEIEGIDSAKTNYVLNSLIKRREKKIGIEKLERNYMRMLSDQKIKDIYPVAVWDSSASAFILHLSVKKEKDLFVSFGGNVSSRPINQGFVGVQYHILRSLSYMLEGNTYFGRFYSSAKAHVKINFPTKLPFYLSTSYVLNKWDYYKSYSTFFEDVKPSYVVMYENFFDFHSGFPLWARAKLELGGNIFNNQNEYYQTNNFQLNDTTDKTFFSGNYYYIHVIQNSLDRKQYPSKGSYFKLTLRLVEGQESTLSASNTTLPFFNYHDWFKARLVYEKYFIRKSPVRFGVYFESVYSTQNFFENYRSSLIMSPAFQPVPESKTLFQDRFRAYKYLGGGFKLIFALTGNLHLRVENYLFQPYQSILADNLQKPYFSSPWIYSYYIGSAQLVYHSPIGPVALNLNYYDKTDQHWRFLFHFGYIIFNRTSLD